MFEKLVEEYHKLVGSEVQNPVVYRSTPMDDSQVTPVTDASVEAPASSDPTVAPAPVETPVAPAPVVPVTPDALVAPATLKFEEFKKEFISLEDRVAAYRNAMYKELSDLLDGTIAELTKFKADHLS